MAPIRRYLRISKYSVLETRIYLDNPALAQSWLLNPRDPVLPRVIESVRPLVLPKLREEQDRERSRKKTKVRSIKDVVVEGQHSFPPPIRYPKLTTTQMISRFPSSLHRLRPGTPCYTSKRFSGTRLRQSSSQIRPN